MTEQHSYTQYRLALFRGDKGLKDLVYTSSSDYDAGDTLPNFLMDVANRLLVLPREEREGFPMSLEIVPTWFLPAEEAIQHVDTALLRLDTHSWHREAALELIRAIHNDPRPEMEPLKELIELDLSTPYEDMLAQHDQLPPWSVMEGSHEFLLHFIATRAKIGPYSEDPELQRLSRVALNKRLAELAGSVDSEKHGTVYSIEPKHWLILGEAGIVEHLKQAERFFGLPPFVKVDQPEDVPEGRYGYQLLWTLSTPPQYTFKQPQQPLYGDLPEDVTIRVCKADLEDRGQILAEMILEKVVKNKDLKGMGRLVVHLNYQDDVKLHQLEDAFEGAMLDLSAGRGFQLHHHNEVVRGISQDVTFVAIPNDVLRKRKVEDHSLPRTFGKPTVFDRILTTVDGEVIGLTQSFTEEILTNLERGKRYLLVGVDYSRRNDYQTVVNQLETFMGQEVFNRVPATMVLPSEYVAEQDYRGVVFVTNLVQKQHNFY